MPPVNIPQLLKGVRSRHPNLREAATDRLRDLGPAAAEAVPGLVEMLLTEKDKEVRECAASVLIHIGEGAAPARPQLLGILWNPQEDEDIRDMAAAAVAEMGIGSAAALRGCLRDPDPFVRGAAAGNFARVKPPPLDCVPDLIEVLEDEDDDICHSAQSSLAEMGEGALPALRQSLARLGGRARVSACQAILAIDPGDQAGLAALAESVQHPDVEVRRRAASALSLTVDDFEHNLLDTPRRRPHPHWAALVPTLLGGLRDPDGEVRCQCAMALGDIRLGHEQVVPALTHALQDPNEEVRKWAALALADFRGRAVPAVRELMQAVEQDADEVRLAAVAALGEIGPMAREAVPLLRKALKDPDGEIRARARSALSKISRR